jgi:hypothetical protein
MLLVGLCACPSNRASLPNPFIFEPSTNDTTQHLPSTAGATSGAAALPQAGGTAVGAALGSSGSGATPPTAAGSAAPTSAGSSAQNTAGKSGTAGTNAGPTAGGELGAGGNTEQPASGTPCMMTIDYTVVGSHGMWYPHNIGAVWVEDTNGHFMKTVERWAAIRADYLAAWNMRESAHGKWPTCFFANACSGAMVPDQTDVVSQATIFEDNQAHHTVWNCKDLNGKVVPDGKYRIFVEEMENIYPLYPAGPLAMFDFDKGATPMTFTPPDTMPFKGMKVVYKPAP